MLELHFLPAYERLALLKALLIANKDSLEEFRFTPTREVSWVGEKIAWKITPLLMDEHGNCLNVRLTIHKMESIASIAREDPDLSIHQSKTRLFSVESVPKYTISLFNADDSSLTRAPILQPTGISLWKSRHSGVPAPPLKPDWMDSDDEQEPVAAGAAVAVGESAEKVVVQHVHLEMAPPSSSSVHSVET